LAMISREVIAGKLGDLAMRALESAFGLASARRDGYLEPHHWLLQILHQPDSDLVRILVQAQRRPCARRPRSHLA
jgi:ATP-dependent Clp protease ATP-binding subunit ClpA